MNLTRNLCLFFLCGVCAPAVYAAGSIMEEAVTLQTVNQNTDETKLKELQEFRKKYKLANPKASENELKSTQMAVKMLMLQRTGDYAVTGADLWGEKVMNQHLRDVAKTVRVLSYGALKNGKSGKADLDLYLDYLFTHNFFLRMPKLVYSNYSDVRTIPTDLMSAIPVCDEVRKAKMIAAVQKLLEVDVILQGDKAILNWISSDYIFNIVPYVFNLALANPNDQQAVQDLQLLSGFLRVCTRYNVGNKDILKPDGTGFHHNAHYNGYMYSYKTWVEYFYRFKGTSFKIDPKSYERLKKAVVTIYMTAVRTEGDKNRIYANSMAGRHPFYSIEVPFTQKLFEQLIEIGADATGTDLDKELAAYYNYFFKTDKYPVPAADANGFYQYNYSSAGVYRQPGWVAVMKSPTAMLWGSEIYNKTNRFGRYQSHGTLEILYDGGLVPTGYPSNNENKGAGWDWNMMPGSTTVHYTDWAEMMPYKNDKDRFDQKARTSNFAGAVSMKDYGLFATAFDQDDRWGSQRFTPTNLTFCKSVLAIDGMLFSIGNGISAKGDYADNMITATNLFQSVVSKQYNKLTVNGQEVTKGNRQNYVSSPPQSMAMGLYLPDVIYDQNIPVFIRQETSSALLDMLNNRIKKESLNRYSHVYPFGMLTNCFDLDRHSARRAQLVNYIYDFKNKYKSSPAACPSESELLDGWNKLQVALQWSNLYCADSVDLKLRSLGFGTTSPLRLTTEQIELMAEVEHNRWNMEKLLLGYRKPTPEEEEKCKDNAVRKEYKTKRFVHTDIRPYYQLDEGTKEYDRCISEGLPLIAEQ